VPGGSHGTIDHAGFDERFISLDIHNQCIRMQVRCGFCKSVRPTLVIETSHDDFASEFPDGTGNALVVGRNEDALDRFGALNAPVNVFYQRLTLNLNDGFSGETSGLESCGDDRYGAFVFHAEYAAEKIRSDYSTSVWTTAVLWLFNCKQIVGARWSDHPYNGAIAAEMCGDGSIYR
jgi:hypothetical protein